MFATYMYNHCNICNIQIKHLQCTYEIGEHLEHTLAMYVYSYCNICNIQMKNIQHPDETPETFGKHTYNICIATAT
jgi:hypothetical protein